jgi:hypothetical protein
MVHYLQVNVGTFGDQENQVKILSSLTSTVSGVCRKPDRLPNKGSS